MGLGTVAGVVAQKLASRGIEMVFGFPSGGSNLELIEALRDVGATLILTRSEGGAAFMAATYGEITGKPGVVVTGVGPAVASVANGVAHAFLDRAPVLLVTDRYSAVEAATTGHQLFDHQDLLRPVTKWRATLGPDNADEVLETAVDTATAPPPGPVHLELPRDAASAVVVPAAGRRREAAAAAGSGARSARSPGDAVRALERATRPVVLVGREATRSVQQGDLVRVAEALTAPVLTTYKAKGVFPETHPLWFGIFTGAEIEAAIVSRADIILAVGLDPVELLTKPWPYQAPVLALRTDTGGDRYYRPRWTEVGDVGRILGEVAGALGESRSAWTREEIEGARTELLQALRLRTGGSLAGWEVVDAVASVLSEEEGETTITVDAGAHMLPVTWFWRSTSAGRFFISNGLSTMGYAVPAAVAASLLRPRETVIAFTGDGGFLLHGTELETAARVGAKVIVVVLNDSSLSLIRVKQEEKGYARAGVDFHPVAFDAYARAFGARGLQASSARQVRSAMRRALAEPRSVVLDVRLPGGEYGELVKRIRG